MTTAPKTVVGLFESFDEAQRVVQDLIDNGFRRDNVSVVANDAEGRYAQQHRAVGDRDRTGRRDADQSEAAEGAGFGATGGTAVGGIVGLLVGIGALTIPGIGPVIAAGPILTAIGTTALGAGLGAAAGGIIGALVGAGIPEQEAGAYAEGVRRGGALVIVQAADIMVERAYSIMQRHGAVDMNERTSQWRQSGWSSFDPNAEPYRR